MSIRSLSYLVAFCCLFAGGRAAKCQESAPVSFAGQIEPILRMHCQGCHQPAKAQGGYALTDFARLMAAGESGSAAVVAGKPDDSELMRQIAVVDGQAAMPKQRPPLHADEIALIRRWIAEGAHDDSPAQSNLIDAQHPPVYSRPPVITTLSHSPDGKWLAVNGFHEVILVSTENYEPVRRLIGLSDRIQSSTFSPDSKLLAVTGGSPGRFGEVQVWSVESGELLLSRQITYDTLYGGSFSPDGKLIAFGATDRVVRAIDAATGEQRLHQGAHEDWSLATVFNPDGTHLVSGGRDMTVKLTEVATERFIDNVTSITPGALKGGINALAIHPKENQILVGGADGSPKIYRIFRETERKIGDDSNLIRKFPAMTGRIFDVSVSADGQIFAAASTLDGQSWLNVYPYDFTGELPDDVRAAMKKRISDRKQEEKDLIERFSSQTSPAIAQIEIPDSLYAVELSPDGKSVTVGGASGIVRQYEVASGKLIREFIPVPIDAAANSNADAEVAEFKLGSGLPIPSESLPNRQTEAELLPKDKLLAIHVQPNSVTLGNTLDYTQLVVTAEYAQGHTVDVTRLADIKSTQPYVGVSDTGVVRHQTMEGTTTGDAKLLIQFQDATAELPVQVAESTDLQFDFVRDVNPVLSRMGCNAGTCHGAQQGKNGFQLSLRGYDPVGDIRALSDDLSARRLNPAAPDASVMLLKPIGAIPHEGGVLATQDSTYYRILRQWIAQGAKLNRESRKVARIEISPALPVIDAVGAFQQFRVVAHYPTVVREM